MVEGGYQIINFKGIEFTKYTPKQLSYVYDKINRTDKTILLSGLNVDGVDYRDSMCTPIVFGNKYVIKTLGFRISITKTDVTVIDEILDFGPGNDSFLTTLNVTDAVYDRMLDCLDGDFGTFTLPYDGMPRYGVFCGSNPINNEVYAWYDGSLRTFELTATNIIYLN